MVEAHLIAKESIEVEALGTHSSKVSLGLLFVDGGFEVILILKGDADGVGGLGTHYGRVAIEFTGVGADRVAQEIVLGVV